MGRIKSFPRKYTAKSEKILKTGTTNKGYEIVVLSKNSKSKTFSLHRIVAETFIENKENKNIKYKYMELFK